MIYLCQLFALGIRSRLCSSTRYFKVRIYIQWNSICVYITWVREEGKKKMRDYLTSNIKDCGTKDKLGVLSLSEFVIVPLFFIHKNLSPVEFNDILLELVAKKGLTIIKKSHYHCIQCQPHLFGQRKCSGCMPSCDKIWGG